MKLKLPNNQTKLCISLSAFPGNTGSRLHNSSYNLLNLNYIYLPLKCKSTLKASLIIKNLEFTGCSLSMPFKQKLIKKVDYLDKISKVTGSINTILKKNNKLYGYNTDYYALKRVLQETRINKNKIKVLLLGNGGVAKTSFQVLKDLNFNQINLSSRKLLKYKNWIKNKNCKFINWIDRNKIEADLLINCTPIGMKKSDYDYSPLSKDAIKSYNTIIDFPVNENQNKLEKIAEHNRINYISGYRLSFYQGLKQFSIYTKKKLNEKIIKKILKIKC